MSALTPIFGAVVGARNRLYDRGVLQTHRLAGAVISVGNISVGGTGKTPFVILLGELLKARRIEFNILSRGYGRKTSGVLLVNPQGTPAEFGDEPVLIARKLGVPVIVGEDRYAAGKFAEQRFGPVLHLLDDGFQHRRLARDYDIVLLTPDDAHDRLLPAGRLREPLSSLARADAVVLTPGTSPEDIPLENKLVMRVARGLALGESPKRPLAFCAIARPERFLSQLREAGVEIAGERRFRDHHAYREQDIDLLRSTAAEQGAVGFVTTEKDAVNLGQLAARLQPLAIVAATMSLENADATIDRVLATVAERHSRNAG